MFSQSKKQTASKVSSNKEQHSTFPFVAAEGARTMQCESKSEVFLGLGDSKAGEEYKHRHTVDINSNSKVNKGLTL